MASHDDSSLFSDAWEQSAPRAGRRLWLHAALFALTLASTTFVGAGVVDNFYNDRPAFDLENDLALYSGIWRDPLRLAAGLQFSLPLITILLAHEFGHYFACLHYGLDASLPYFLPAPTFIGTLGAFIRIRSPIYSRQQLFDVGIAGPIAGLVFVIPALGCGLAFSKVIPGIAEQGDLAFGVPLLLRALEAAAFPGVPSSDIYLHPIARAAWVGIFATALNLLPFGQLDGGHILYATNGDRFRTLVRVFWVLLIPLGRFYWPWWAWAAVLFFFGLKHPTIYDPFPLSPGRRRLAWITVGIFLLCFMPAPIATAGF